MALIFDASNARCGPRCQARSQSRSPLSQAGSRSRLCSKLSRRRLQTTRSISLGHWMPACFLDSHLVVWTRQVRYCDPFYLQNPYAFPKSIPPEDPCYHTFTAKVADLDPSPKKPLLKGITEQAAFVANFDTEFGMLATGCCVGRFCTFTTGWPVALGL